MFTFGPLDANNTPGLMAILKDVEHLPEVQLATVASPGRDGVFFAEAAHGPGKWVFDLTAVAATPNEVTATAAQVAEALSPRLGIQPLTMSIAPGFGWGAVLAQELRWTRGHWAIGAECQLNATATFTTPDPYGYAIVDDTWNWTTTGSRTATLNKGNTGSRPTIEARAVLTAAQTITITIDGTPVQVTGPLTAAQKLRLDYTSMDFGIWNTAGTVKQTSAAPRMDRFDQLELPPGDSTIAVATTGTLTELTVRANSRRI